MPGRADEPFFKANGALRPFERNRCRSFNLARSSNRRIHAKLVFVGPRNLNLIFRAQRSEYTHAVDPIAWPDAKFELDDEAFARAIAEGREDQIAA